MKVKVTATPEKWEGHGGAEVGEVLIVAKELFKEVIRHHCEEIAILKGSDLIGKSYQPLFPEAVDRGDSESAWTVIGADWVTTTDGTGVVHTAVMYGRMIQPWNGGWITCSTHCRNGWFIHCRNSSTIRWKVRQGP